MKEPCIYILASKKDGALYIGVTSDLIQRIWQHKNHVVQGHSQKYKTNKLVYYEQYQSIEDAILREKRMKKWNRQWKINLIEGINPEWRDLWSEIQLKIEFCLTERKIPAYAGMTIKQKYET